MSAIRAVGRMTASLAIVDAYNGFVRDISDQLLKGTVTMNEDLRIPMAFSATLRDPSVVRPQIDYLAPRLRVAWNDGSVVESQVGQYAVLPPSEQRHRWPGTEATIDARDMTWKVDAYAFDRTFTVAAGTDVVDAVTNILAYAGLYRHRLVTGRARLTEPRSFTAGTPALDMVNELLSGIGWYRLWPDSTGVLTSRAYQDTADAEPAVTYRSGPGTELMTDTIVEKSPGAPAVNRIVVIKDTFSSSDATPIIAIRTNTNPASPTSTVTTGTLVSRTVRDSTLVDQAAADALADRLLREAGGRYRVLTLKTLPDPRRGMHETYGLNVSNRATRRIATGNWRCRTWELGFTPIDGLMSHEVNVTEAVATGDAIGVGEA